MTLVKHVKGFFEHIPSLRVLINHVRYLRLHPIDTVSIGNLSLQEVMDSLYTFFHRRNGLLVHILEEVTIKALVESLFRSELVVLPQKRQLTLQDLMLSLLNYLCSIS